MANATKRRSIRPAAKKAKRAPRSSTAQSSKLDQIEAALRAAKGATISDLMELTGWQAHSVRGALAGAIKNKRGLAITSTKVGDERIYKVDGKK